MHGVRTGAGESVPKFNLADRCRRSRNQELSDLHGSSPAKFLTMLPVSRGSVREKRPAPLIATWLFGTYQLICDRRLYRGVRGAEPHRNRADDRLHRQRHRGRICDESCVASDLGFDRIRHFKSTRSITPACHGGGAIGRNICIIVVLNRSSVTRPDHARRFAANCARRCDRAKMAGVMV